MAKKAPWAPPALYDAAQAWVERCLRRDGSLFTPEAAIWTLEVIDEAAEPLLFEDIREGLSYMEKLKDRLAGASDAAKQFAAELHYVHTLTISNTGVAAKRALVEPVLSWMEHPVELPESLIEPLSDGVANYGAGIAQRDRYIKYFVRFAQAWKRLSAEEVGAILEDPWAFREFVHDLGGPPLMQREAILHLVFPEMFEYAIAPGDKKAIAKAFVAMPGLDERNDDRSLESIRNEIEAAIGRPLNLYAPWFRRIWGKSDWGDWGEVLNWARKLYESPEFDEAERDYKLIVGEHMRAAREALTTGGDWIPLLKSAFGKPNNLTHWQFEHGPFLQWVESSTDEAAAFLQELWQDGSMDDSRLEEAFGLLPSSTLGSPAARLALVATLLLGLDPTLYPPYRATRVQKFVELLGEDPDEPDELEPRAYTPVELGSLLAVDPKRVRDVLRQEFPRGSDAQGEDWVIEPEMAQVVAQQLRRQDVENEAQLYYNFLTLLDELRVRLLAQGVALRDRLDAQGIVWWLANGGAPDAWDDAEKAAFEAFRMGDDAAVPQQSESSKRPPNVRTGVVKAWLVRGANVDGENVIPQWLAEGFVSVGWQELGHLDDDLSDTEIWERVRAAFPDDPPGASRVAAGNLNRFLNLIKADDLVLTADGDRLYVARVTGDATYDETFHAATSRRRSVEWLNADAPASRARVQDEYPSLYSKLRTLLTVTDLKEDAKSVAALIGAVEKPTSPELRLPTVTQELAESLHLPRAWLQETVLDLLVEKKQLVFYGPPGTGKTLVAQSIAQHLVGDGGEYELIQFHPSYSYEDFFEGYRPAQVDGGVGVTYELTPGPLRRIAAAAADDPAHPYVLIIDEINRGNVPKIFGELLFLLEYRAAQIPLQYSPQIPFGLPKNLFVIATMNTADRSIALVDAALRRRFYFVPFMPREAPVRDVLSEWLERNDLDQEPARLMHELNERIASDEIAIGPSYFMTADGTSPNVERVWQHAILPLLEEHYYGTGRNVHSEFSLDALRAELEATKEPELGVSGEEPSPAPTT